LQSMRRDVLSPLSMIIEKKPIEASLPLTEVQLAAQAKVDALAEHQNPVVRAVTSLANGVSSRAGLGYALGATDVARVGAAAAKSDWDGFIGSAKLAVRQVATTAAVAGTAAASLPFAGAVVATSIASSMAKDYKLMVKASQILGPTIERVHSEAYALRNVVTDQGQAAYDKLVAMIPRDAKGNLTPEGLVVMQRIEQNAAQQVDSAVALIPPAEIPGP